MPTETAGGPIPALMPDKWADLVEALIARSITTEEKQRIEKMARHNWTARIVAEDILGRDLTTEEVEERNPNMGENDANVDN